MKKRWILPYVLVAAALAASPMLHASELTVGPKPATGPISVVPPASGPAASPNVPAVPAAPRQGAVVMSIDGGSQGRAAIQMVDDGARKTGGGRGCETGKLVGGFCILN